jgi:hypothetical protein
MAKTTSIENKKISFVTFLKVFPEKQLMPF